MPVLQRAALAHARSARGARRLTVSARPLPRNAGRGEASGRGEVPHRAPPSNVSSASSARNPFDRYRPTEPGGECRHLSVAGQAVGRIPTNEGEMRGNWGTRRDTESEHFVFPWHGRDRKLDARREGTHRLGHPSASGSCRARDFEDLQPLPPAGAQPGRGCSRAHRPQDRPADRRASGREGADEGRPPPQRLSRAQPAP